MSRGIRVLGLIILPWVCLAGCDAATGRPDAEAASAEATVQAPHATKARAIARMSHGKPHAPVGLVLDGEPDPLVPGVPAALTLLLQSEVAADGVELSIQGSGGIEVLSPVERLFLGSAGAGGVLRVPVQLVASEGRAPPRLEVLVIVEAGGERLARPVSLNLRVDGQRRPAEAPMAPASSKVAPVIDSTGELIHSMKAETILK